MNGKAKHAIGPLEIVQVCSSARHCKVFPRVCLGPWLSCRQRWRRIRRINFFHHLDIAHKDTNLRGEAKESRSQLSSNAPDFQPSGMYDYDAVSLEFLEPPKMQEQLHELPGSRCSILELAAFSSVPC